MRYSIVRVDLDKEREGLELAAGTCGYALELFHEGRPVGFLMHESADGATVSAQEISAIIDDVGGCIELDMVQDRKFAECEAPPITIAVCTKDHPDLLERCLCALERLDGLTSEVTVLVVDNASSSPATRYVSEAHNLVRYVREELQGLNFARNRALSEAPSGIIAFIDDDAVADPCWLNGLRQAWRRAPDAGAFTGQVFAFELESESQILVERMGGFRKGYQPIIHGRDACGDPLFPVTTAFGNGCNMAFDVAKIRAVGGFDNALDMGHYLPGGGDLDALFSIVRAGNPLVYEPTMLVRHQHRVDMAGLRRQIRMSWGAGTMAFLTKIRDHDAKMAQKASRFISWWIRDLVRRTMFLQSRNGIPWRMILEELVGAIIGLSGIYGRAQSRVDIIKRRARG